MNELIVDADQKLTDLQIEIDTARDGRDDYNWDSDFIEAVFDSGLDMLFVK